MNCKAHACDGAYSITGGERQKRMSNRRSRLPHDRKYSTVSAFPGSCAEFVSNIRDLLAVDPKHIPTQPNSLVLPYEGRPILTTYS